jgi:hypothetical protein
VSFQVTSTSVGVNLSPLAGRIYVVSSPIIAYYYTQIIGDARTPPTLRARSNFSGIAVIGKPFFFHSDLGSILNCVVDADPYIPNGNGAQWYINQNNMQVSTIATALLYPLIHLPTYQVPFCEELRYRSSPNTCKYERDRFALASIAGHVAH